VELFFVEQSARAMQQAGVYELHVPAHSFLIKTGEQGRRTCPVKTLVVIKHAHSQNCLPYLFLRVCSEKQLELLVWRIMSFSQQQKPCLSNYRITRLQNYKIRSRLTSSGA